MPGLDNGKAGSLGLRVKGGKVPADPGAESKFKKGCSAATGYVETSLSDCRLG